MSNPDDKINLRTPIPKELSQKEKQALKDAVLKTLTVDELKKQVKSGKVGKLLNQGTAEHMNDNLICAIDIETTGLSHIDNEIVQICVMPVNHDWTPSRIHPPFHIKMPPQRPENIQSGFMNRQLIADAINTGIDPYSACDLFEDWFQKLRLPAGKKLIPLGHNYITFDRLFIMKWLGGPLNYDYYFRSDARDTVQIAMYLNDVADHFRVKVPFPRWTLTQMCTEFQIEHPLAHDAMGDCVAVLKVYKQLLSFASPFPFRQFQLISQTERTSNNPEVGKEIPSDKP